MVQPDPFDYDVALSFAEGDRAAAGELARLLAERNLDVLIDEDDLQGKKARYFLIFVSQHFPLPQWTKVEREAREAGASILPLRVDDTNLPGVEQAAEAPDLRQHSLEDIADRLAETIMKAKQPGPPSQSHDLRSGNVPRARDDQA